MSKILYGILNWNRPEKNVTKIINKINVKKEDLLIVSNCFRNENYNVIEAPLSVAASRNLILKKAKDEKYDYAIIIDDDVKIIDNSIFKYYFDMMEQFKYGVIMYGYHGKNNRIVGNKPNPAMIIKTTDTREVYVNRYPCSGVIIHKIFEDQVFYDENLKLLELEYLLVDMRQKNQIPFLGFNLDFPVSWKYLDRTEDSTQRNKNNKLLEEDLDFRKTKIKLDDSADKLLDYLKERI